MKFQNDKIDKAILNLGWFLLFMMLFLMAGKAYGTDDVLLGYSHDGIPVYESELVYNIDQDSMECLAKNIYFESANQSFAGKLAVAHVVMNRKESDLFPMTVCDVVYQAKTKINWKGNEVPIRNQCQFSWYCDGKSDEPVDSKTWMKSLWIADLVLSGHYPDITEGSLWYHADFVSPYWSEQLELVTTIDNHLFYK
tara:strand:+ start:536 stop:1123 length:588 start_codon:yes stop_codon:yes gene_type:complete